MQDNNEIENNEQITEASQPQYQSKNGKIVSGIFDIVEVFVFALTAVLIVYTFLFRICSVDGTSMNNTLQDSERLVISNLFYEPEVGDIIVFHETGDLDEPLVKRVIATEGQTVKVDFYNGKTYVDGNLIEDLYNPESSLGDYVYLESGMYYTSSFYCEGGKYLDDDGCYVRTVPEGCVFVMGDNRNKSQDSRYPSVGMVDERSILGKVLFRLNPLGKVE